MKNTYLCLIALMVLAPLGVGLISGCSSNLDALRFEGSAVIGRASWLKSFQDLEEMATDSDLVVKGTVVAVVQPSRVIGGPNPPRKVKEAGIRPGVLFTDYILLVEQVLKGQTLVHGTITVVQTGGIYNGITYYMEDDPLFQIGEHVVLFLHDISGDPIHAPNTQKYVLNGTPQARFRTTYGRVAPILTDDSFVAEFAGMSEGDFIRAIQATQQSATP